MAYQALARKWRPRNFSEVVGQEHVVKALTHALEFDRLHHAYLFTGTRGVGKTTLARILAKAMNCEARVGFNPCGVCQFCRELDEGRFVDLIEVDAASRTKVEDTRDLLENVQYAPNQGRFKVYLIDEVHMLSGHSFNALLKTLEEPPPHVKFLLATTDPQKIPVTVLSRCLQFNLKRLTPEQIRGQMEAILSQEGIAFEQNALRSLSRAADGSMRDGLSLLDQGIVHGGGSLEDGPVSAMLGTVSRKPVFALLDALANGDAAALLREVEELAGHAPNFADVLQQLLIVLHHAALAQWVPDAIRHDDDAERIIGLAKRLSPEDLQLFYQIGLLGQRDLPLAPEPRGGFEMTLLRMLAFRPAGHGEADQPSQPLARATKPAQAAPRTAAPAQANAGESPLASLKEMLNKEPAPRKPAVLHPAVGVAPQPSRPPAPPPEDAPPPWLDQSPPWDEEDHAPPLRPVEPSRPRAVVPPPAPLAPASAWPDIIKQMRLGGMSLELANHCVLLELAENQITLKMDPRVALLRSGQVEANLEKALQAYFKRPLKLLIKLEKPEQETPALQNQRHKDERQKAAEQEIEQDPVVLALKERLDARIVPGSIKPLD
jgi:DNA polymerase-3 subunit gamma/tau